MPQSDFFEKEVERFQFHFVAVNVQLKQMAQKAVIMCSFCGRNS